MHPFPAKKAATGPLRSEKQGNNLYNFSHLHDCREFRNVIQLWNEIFMQNTLYAFQILIYNNNGIHNMVHILAFTFWTEILLHLGKKTYCISWGKRKLPLEGLRTNPPTGGCASSLNFIRILCVSPYLLASLNYSYHTI